MTWVVVCGVGSLDLASNISIRVESVSIILLNNYRISFITSIIYTIYIKSEVIIVLLAEGIY